MLELRDYQQECVDRVLAAYKENPFDCELLVLPCGAGKTVIFSTVIDALARAYGLMAVVIAHRDELLRQAKDKYLQVRPSAVIGKVGGGIAEYGGEVTVCGIATISRPNHIKQLKNLYGDGKGLIIVVDEAHHVAANGYQTVLNAFPQAFKLFVTATPDRLDGKKILDKKPLYECYLTDMVQWGYSCPPRAIAIKTQVDLNKVDTSMGDFNQHQLDLAVNTPKRNQLVLNKYQEHTPGECGIGFGCTVAHCEVLAYCFNENGVPSAVVSANTSLEEREKLYKDLETGVIRIIWNVDILTEGADFPFVRVILMTRPTKSRALYVQCVGRGSRLFPNKEFFTILDLTDNCLKHRLQPMNLNKMLGKELKDGETLTEALEREEEEKKQKEASEREAQVRKLKEKRVKDIHIDLLQKLEWVDLPGGGFVLTVGAEKHRIAIIPSKKQIDMFDVWARLAPAFEAQCWMKTSPIEECQQMAEKKARLLHQGKTSWVDKNNPRRYDEITDNQKKLLDWYKIPYGLSTNVTNFGQASDAIDEHKAKIEARKAAAAARKAARAQKKEVEV